MGPFLWDIDYELGSCIILGIVLIFLIMRKQLKTRQTRMFTELIVMFMATILADVISTICLSEAANIPKAINYIIAVIYYCLACTLPLFFLFYVLQVAHRTEPLVDKMKLAVSSVALVMMIISILTPFTGWLYELVDNPDGSYTYVSGPLWSLTFINSLFYFINIIIASIRNGKRIGKTRQIVIIAFTLISMSMTFTQMLFLKNILLTYLSGGVLGVFLYLTLENPDSYTDRLTGLLNFEGFSIIVKDYFEKRKQIYAYAIKVENIEEIGRIFDKSAEEKYRAQISQILNEEFHAASLKPCMLSDDVFIVISDKVFHEEKLKTLITILKDSKFQGRKVEVGISSCIIDVTRYASTVEQLTAMVRHAISRSHLSGEEIVEFCDDDTKSIERQEKIAHLVRHSEQNDSLRVYYQPICDSVTGKIVAAEALCRFKDPELGIILPYEFIELAEKNASIIQLGRQVFEKVCKFIAANDIKKYGLKYISVNFSPVQCMQADIAADVNKAIRENHVDPSLITIEITESVQLNSFEHASKMMNRIKMNGIKFSLDDYGTGFSNLSYIGQMNFDVVKLDRSLIVAYFEKGVELLPNTVKMFKELKLPMVAEGIETKEQAEALREFGCETLQGYYFAKPLPEEEFVEYMKNHS
ncbi:MAG: EAL domain-containing protein [Lachnospiraceae bacterium]|nr:EAL domain-containing protein [Lachnospiraceae bacterium]